MLALGADQPLRAVPQTRSGKLFRGVGGFGFAAGGFPLGGARAAGEFVFVAVFAVFGARGREHRRALELQGCLRGGEVILDDIKLAELGVVALEQLLGACDAGLEGLEGVAVAEIQLGIDVVEANRAVLCLRDGGGGAFTSGHGRG